MHPLHVDLLEAYVRELGAARDVALARQAGRLQTWTRRLGSEARAQEKLAGEQPPCVDMRVIAVLRKYWLASEALNRELGAQGTDTMTFMTDHLEARSLGLAAFICEIPYWPIGMDAQGCWI
jgi:hypothetical protein